MRKTRILYGAVALFVLGIVFLPLPAARTLPTARHLHLEAGDFAFQPGAVYANPGDTITLELAAMDVAHGFYLDGYELDLTAEPGQTATLTFVADQSGKFRFRCSVTCGPLHPFMIGKLVVGSNPLYWRTLALAGLLTMTVWRTRSKP